MQSVDMRASNVRARDERHKKKFSQFKDVHLRNFERNLDYYKVTFSDPLYAAFHLDEDMRQSMAGSSKNSLNKTRKRNLNKTLVMQTFAK